MNRIAIAPVASALLRGLIDRAEVPRNKILLTEAITVEWCSLTFTGERHQLQLRIPPPDSRMIMKRMCDGLEDAEFNIPGAIVADIGFTAAPERHGSTTITIEALTVSAD
jgi:hypothetical protein